MGKRGGKREGAGRPKATKLITDQIRKNYIAADKYFSRYLAGEDIKPKHITSEMVNVGFIHGLIWMRSSQTWIPAKIQDSVRVAAQKVRQEALVIRESKQTVEQIDYGPKIGLPEIKKKPENEHFPVVNTRPS